jgi:hypothetical protein
VNTEQVAEAVVSGAGRAEGVKWMVVGDEEKELGGKCAKGRHAGVSEAVVFGPRLGERKTKDWRPHFPRSFHTGIKCVGI